MSKNIHIQIDINALRDFIKENPAYVFKGKKDYISLTLWANDGPDKFGNDYAVKPRLSKEMKDAGTKAPFVGNGKTQGEFNPNYAAKPAHSPIRNAAPKAAPKVELDEEVPF